MLSARTKRDLGFTAAKQLASHPDLVPPVTRMGFSIVKPVARRRARKQAERIGEASRTVAVMVATGAPYLARALESRAPQRRRRTVAPAGAGAMVGAGALLGASAVYFLAPGAGRRHREQVLRLVG